MSSTAMLCASGVGQIPGVSDAIGDIAGELETIPGVEVMLYRWRKWHTGKVAEYAARLANAHILDGATVNVMGHSRGGQFAIDVCAELDELGVPVAGAYLADPWERDGDILVPKNVAAVHVWWKAGGLIKTADIVRASQATTVETHLVHVNHARVDEAPEFRAAVIAAARGD
jgi:pimeloyl-ACP methyl ester carboxylesterase